MRVLIAIALLCSSCAESKPDGPVADGLIEFSEPEIKYYENCDSLLELSPGYREIEIDEVEKYFDLVYDGKTVGEYFKEDDEANLKRGTDYCVLEKELENGLNCYKMSSMEVTVGGGLNFCVQQGREVESLILGE